MEIYYDNLQEGIWFQGLHPNLANAALVPFPAGVVGPPPLRAILSYDRPDIVLVDRANPILVLERTIEVPSGHNVGQRFARLVAAAQARVPLVYFGPYAAYKHGGATQGPRYMNLRLFYALDKLAQIEKTAVTIINWPVDESYEIVQTPFKDIRVQAYLELFFSLYSTYGLPGMLKHIMQSSFEEEQEAERREFIARQVVQPEQYDQPPPSVKISPWQSLPKLASQNPRNLSCSETVFYRIGMQYIRSDPYTGMAMLYGYLYCGGMRNRTRDLVLYFPNIDQQTWRATARDSDRKDIRLYRLVADGILFSDGYLPKSSL